MRIIFLSLALLAATVTGATAQTSCDALKKGRQLPCSIDFGAFSEPPSGIPRGGRVRLVRSAGELNNVKPQPGDEIVLANGNWNNVRLQVHALGTPTQPIVIRGETPNGVVMTGESTARFSGTDLIIRDLAFRNGVIRRGDATVVRIGDGARRPCVRCRFDRLSIENFNSAPEDWERLKAFYVVAQGESITIENSIFADKENVGAVVLATDSNEGSCARDRSCFQRFVFRNNRVSNISKDVRHRRLEAGKYIVMQIGSSEAGPRSSYSIVENNLFEHADGGTQTLAIKGSDIIIRNNHFRANLGTVNLRSTNRALIANNTFDGTDRTGMGGVIVTGKGHWIVGNTFRNLLNPINEYHIPISMPAAEDETVREGSNKFARARDVVIADNSFDRVSSPVIGLGVFPRGRPLMPEDIYVYNNVFRLAGPGLAMKSGGDGGDGPVKFMEARNRYSNIRIDNNRIEP